MQFHIIKNAVAKYEKAYLSKSIYTDSEPQDLFTDMVTGFKDMLDSMRSLRKVLSAALGSSHRLFREQGRNMEALLISQGFQILNDNPTPVSTVRDWVDSPVYHDTVALAAHIDDLCKMDALGTALSMQEILIADLSTQILNRRFCLMNSRSLSISIINLAKRLHNSFDVSKTCQVPSLRLLRSFTTSNFSNTNSLWSGSLLLNSKVRRIRISLVEPHCTYSLKNKVLTRTFHDFLTGEFQSMKGIFLAVAHYSLPAAMAPTFDCVKSLLLNGAICSTEYVFCRTPLSWAAVNGDVGVVRLLLLNNSEVEVDSEDIDGYTPLALAASQGHERIVQLLLETDEINVNARGYLDERTPLAFAACEGQECVVKLLLETDEIEVDLPDLRGRTPLSLAAGNGHAGTVKLLLESDKVDVLARDCDGDGPLWWARDSGSSDVIQLLIEAGAEN